ncbi:MAG TPA: TIGR01777 family oxidoreductase [Micromonosporaceae bacterium]|jgi:hypothetical protein
MRVVMAGSSGFLGSHLRANLAADGHEVIRLVRRAPAAADERRWDPGTALDPELLAGAEVVVNLAGAGVEDKRWSPAYRRVLVESRVQPTRTIATALAALSEPARPRLLLNASAVGFYGNAGDTTVDETSPAGLGFFPDACRDWEAATGPAADAGVRVVLLRTGLVLGHGGLLRPLALTTRLFLGGPLGSGRQWMPWISMTDWLGAVRFVIGRADIAGPVNVVGPDPVRNKDFSRALGRVLHRPTPWPVPRLALRIVLGEFADEALVSQRVLPGVLAAAGYAFQHTDVTSALHAALAA